MKKAVWCVVRNEEFYIDMAIKSVIEQVDGVFVVDTGSTDGTIDILVSLWSQYPKKMRIESKSFGGDRKFGPEYQEADARNYAMERTLETFKPEWLIQIDADEVYNDRFWEVLDTEVPASGAVLLGHSTSIPLSDKFVSDSPHAANMWGTMKLFDPHERSWSAKLPAQWIKPPGRHVVPRMKTVEGGEGFPLNRASRYVTPDHVHFHLHRAFGPKCLHAWFTTFTQGWESAASNLKIPYELIHTQKIFEEKFPERFVNGRFIPPEDVKAFRNEHRKPLSHPIPQFVVDKWNAWGDLG